MQMQIRKDERANEPRATATIAIKREDMQRIMSQVLEYRRHTIALEAANKRLIELLVAVMDEWYNQACIISIQTVSCFSQKAATSNWRLFVA